MKKFLLKIAITAIVVFLGVLLCAPALLYAQPDLVSVTVTPEIGEIWAFGQTVQYTAIARYTDESEVDVTATATWGIDDPAIATNNGGGLFTATAGGNTGINATFEGVIGDAILSVYGYSYLEIFAGAPGETTYFSFGIEGCNGLSWELVVTKDGNGTVLTTSGTITSDDWDHEVSTTLDAGDYTATFSVGGTAQQVRTFSIFELELSMDISVGYAGEDTTFILNATNSSGKTAHFWLFKEVGVDLSLVYDEEIPVDSDDWSYTITRALEAGTYWTDFSIEGYSSGFYNFSVVDRGVQQPPAVVENAVVEKAVAKKAATVRRGPAINEKPLSSYGKTASGFSTLFYNRILRRNPEKEGLDAWIARLESGEITGSDLIQQFIFGEECQKIISGYSNEEFITFLYKAIFNRAPGEDGLNAWLARMSAGMTKEEVVKQFGLSEEFVILCNFFGIKPYPGYIENSN